MLFFIVLCLAATLIWQFIENANLYNELQAKREECRSRLFSALASDSAFYEENEIRQKYEDAIRKHRDQNGDDRCWIDDDQLYSILPETLNVRINTALPTKEKFLGNCARFYECRQHPNDKGKYVTVEEQVAPMREKLEHAKLVLRSIRANPLWGVEVACEEALKKLGE
jgi:hypothetical protein